MSSGQQKVNGNLVRYDSFTMSLDQLLEEEELPNRERDQLHQSNTRSSSSHTRQRDQDVTSDGSSLSSSQCSNRRNLNMIDEEIAKFVDKLEGSPSSRRSSDVKRKKRPYFRRSKYSKEVIAEFEARKKIQKRERNRVLAAESRHRQKERVSILESENENLRNKLEHVTKRLRLYEDLPQSWN